MKYDNFRSLKVRVEDHFPLIAAPQTKFAKVMFYMCLSVCPGGCLQAHIQGQGVGVRRVSRPTPGGGVPRPRLGWGVGVSQHALRQTPPPAKQTASAAGGMHPTGMHSCVQVRFHTASSCGEKVYAKLVTLTEFTCMCDRVALSGQNSSTYLPDISSQVQGHKVKDRTGQVYEWDGPLPPAMLYKPSRPSEPRMHRAHNKHHCDYYRFIKKGMARHIPVSFITSVAARFH